MRCLNTCGLMLVVLATSVMAAQFRLGSVDFEVTAYRGHTLRLRLRAKADVYEVSDVVVASPGSDPQLTNCDLNSCTATHGNTFLHISRQPAVEGQTEERYAATYSVGGRDVSSAVLYLSGSEPKADFTFPHASRLYGIPEHAVDLALKNGMAYRLMNLDVFKYRLDDAGGIYGTIPFLMAHGPEQTTAVLFLNSADSSVTPGAAANGGKGLTAHWRCESGIHDIFFFAGPTPAEVHLQHSHVVGPTLMPPLFSLGYHQCRWNYRSITDSLEVDDGFDTHNIPYDVLWLDIEHTDGKRYFTWDQHNFGNPEQLTSSLAAKGRKLVTITDPHIKRDDNYHVHREARDQGFYVKSAQGGDFEGHCWPGQSSWVDFYNENARKWYATLFKYDRYKGSAPNVYTWIDMNEPSVFNAHEVTMDKGAQHHTAAGKAVAHRDVHNMYGYYHTMAAYDGHILRSSGPPHDKLTRPFILTRSFFSGSQRYAAMWTGDNMAEWSHLRKAIPMLLTLSLSNYIFVGADVGGFFDNPSSELLVRWYQAAIFTPFLRGHAHLETKRREPWLFGDEVTNQIRDAIALRYALLPYLYTTFFDAHDRGYAVMRPMFYEWPREDRWLEEQNAYMFGPSLLVRPVVDEGAQNVVVNLPTSDTWFHFPSGDAVAAGTESLTMAVTMNTIPVFLRGGRILPIRERLRRSSASTLLDPVTLYVAANARGDAIGELYLDDSHSFDFQQGSYVLASVSLSGNRLSATPSKSTRFPQGNTFVSGVLIDKIVLLGFATAPKGATVNVAAAGTVSVGSTGAAAPSVRTLDVLPHAENGATVIRKPQLSADAAWSIELSF